jgi:hypothetical protein
VTFEIGPEDDHPRIQNDGMLYEGLRFRGECRRRGWVPGSVVAVLVLRWWNVPDGLEEAAVVEPVDPLERRELDAVDVAPGTAPTNHLGLVQHR